MYDFRLFRISLLRIQIFEACSLFVLFIIEHVGDIVYLIILMAVILSKYHYYIQTLRLCFCQFDIRFVCNINVEYRHEVD